MLVTPPAELQKLLSATPELARAFLVGGCVRDALLGLAVKDFDLEVFGVSYERLAKGAPAVGQGGLRGPVLWSREAHDRQRAGV